MGRAAALAAATSVAVVTFLVVVAVLLVNVCLPGVDRRLVDRAAAARAAASVRGAADRRLCSRATRALSKVATWLALVLALAGGVEMFLFQGAGGRVPHDIADPLVEAVWPLWAGEPVPWWRFNERFCRNLTVLAAPDWVRRV